ncbi:methyl-accepting chemotaxis protein [Thalassospira sp. TSL5-1]|uniref:methyl-accepting chemotaxis protein n=1 Tax=Thalassospira sp. TSL5-1 TaxID=1544451 RepID=UPI000940034F|nr:methyl-accepting chemotaxis protein [Thalassospira sp. TSL5-1]OKH86814.1 chemotaxis protein [Thalassospira sp. TSL5-1]
MNFLKNIKIAYKISAGFGITLVLLLAVAIIGVLALQSGDTNFNRYRLIANQSNLANEMLTNILDTRLVARMYKDEPTQELSERALKNMKNALDLGDQLQQLIVSPERDQMVRAIKTDINTFVAEFNSLLASKDPAEQEHLLAEKIRPIGGKLRRNLDQFTDSISDEQNELGGRVVAENQQAIITGEIIAAIAVIFGIAAAWVIGNGISRPILTITESMRKLSDGDKTVEIPGTDHKDEIGEMAAAVIVFKENMIKAEELAAEEVKAQQRREERTKVIEKLTNDFDADVSVVLRTVASAATEMQATATSMTATAEETSRQSTAVAAAAEQASSNVETVAGASEELTNSIARISQQVSQSAQVANKAVAEADRTNSQVRGLAEAAQKIGDVVGLISDIAAQTNLLALNATIEAARAGDAGKGFAVVAAEVKNLANATSRATDDITSQITGIQQETNGAVGAIQSISATITEINEIASSIASAIEEQGSATEEITRNVQQASAGTREVTSNIHGVNEAASSTGAAAEQVLSASGDLSQQAEDLRKKVETFLNSVKAA